jgi:peptidoglycan hydrolase-like protein with peptidoglycan-binding domain
MFGAIAVAISAPAPAAAQYTEPNECLDGASHYDIAKGDAGDAVFHAQCLLNVQGYGLELDGQFGDKTDAAVRDFQRASGLEVDGVVGECTWATLHPLSVIPDGCLRSVDT